MHDARTLAVYLTALHRHGYWIDAWYPLSDGRFECRIRNISVQTRCRHDRLVERAHTPTAEWGANTDPLIALAEAMDKARIRI